MLHELLVELLGLPFVSNQVPLKDERNGSTFEKDMQFISSSKMSEIKTLLPLGSLVRSLATFVINVRSINSLSYQEFRSEYISRSQSTAEVSFGNRSVNFRQVNSRNEERSLYQLGFASGIEEILGYYRETLVKAEEEIMADPIPRVSIITSHIEKFQVIIPFVSTLSERIKVRNLRGGQLLEELYQQSVCGVPVLKDCMLRLLWHCQAVMFRQLSNWILYGILRDPHDEFFIARNSLSRLEASRTSLSIADWNSEFVLKKENMPSFLSIDLGNKVLFVGKAVRVLRNPTKAFVSQVSSTVSRAASRASSLAGSPVLASRFVPENMSEDEFLPREQVEQIAVKLRILEESQQLHIPSLLEAVHFAHQVAARHLWQLIMVHADVSSALLSLKNYFLLGKGHLFQSFIEGSRALMRLPPNSTSSEAEINASFTEAAIRMGCDDDPYFSKVSLRLPQHVSAISSPSEPRTPSENLPRRSLIKMDGWDDLSLHYRSDWPLALLITQETLDKYNLMFRHLFWLKRIQAELEMAWSAGRDRDRADASRFIASAERAPRGSHRQLFWSLRRSMADLVSHLQYYIQVDVLETHWVQLESQISESRDFTEIVDYHDRFLDTLLTQSFQNLPVVLNVIGPVLQTCLMLCVETQRSMGSPSLQFLTEQAKTFQKQSKSLYMLLNSPRLAGSTHAPFLRQFLVRLNFNSYYQNSVVEQGTTFD